MKELVGLSDRELEPVWVYLLDWTLDSLLDFESGSESDSALDFVLGSLLGSSLVLASVEYILYLLKKEIS